MVEFSWKMLKKKYILLHALCVRREDERTGHWKQTQSFAVFSMGQVRHFLPGLDCVEKKQCQIEVIWMGGKWCSGSVKDSNLPEKLNYCVS